MSQAQSAKVKVARMEFAAAERDRELYHAIHATPRSNTTRLVDQFLKSGKCITRCKAQKHHSESKRGQAIVGPTTEGRKALWGGRRWIYSK